MKKRVIFPLLAALMLLALTGCQEEAGPMAETHPITVSTAPETSGPPAASQPIETGDIPSEKPVTCRVKLISERVMLAVGWDETGNGLGLCFLSFPDEALSGPDGEAITANELRPGMILDITYDSDISPEYPAIVTVHEAQVVEQGDDLVGMYRQALNELWTESGQKTGVEHVAFDLADLTDLTTQEQSALAYLVSCDLEMAESYIFSNCVGTWDELEASGVIVPDEADWWPNGMLLTLSLYSQEKNHVEFIASSSRAKEGAVLVLTCMADRQEDGSWSYQSFSPSGT